MHGDNLHALKALLPNYAARIKCIYIDPPYNTGSEKWVYSDNVNSPLMQTWLEQNQPVDGEDLERHDKWLCMMWPRLQLLRELLAEDGVICVSIDDHEQHRLRLLMDEIFGEDNFRNIIIVRRGVKNVQAQFETIERLNSGQEYIVCYTKNPESKFDHLTIEISRESSWNNHWRGTDRPTMRYELMGELPEEGQWRWKEEKSRIAIRNYEKLLEEIGPEPSQQAIDEWYFQQSPEKPDLLRKSADGTIEHYVPSSDRRIIGSLWNDLIANESASYKKKVGIRFDNPKRTDLIKRVVRFATGTDKDAIVLDSFAGSGTTAHAVLALNKEDDGKRQFILVESENYADSVTAERVRRVICGVPEARDEVLREGLGGCFTYCTLGEPIDPEEMLTGSTLPPYSELAAYLLHTATGISTTEKLEGDPFYQQDEIDYYLLYEPNLEWLGSEKAMLNLKRAKEIAARKREAVVFAAGKYIGQRELTKMEITFCQLPYGLYQR